MGSHYFPLFTEPDLRYKVVLKRGRGQVRQPKSDQILPQKFIKSLIWQIKDQLKQSWHSRDILWCKTKLCDWPRTFWGSRTRFFPDMRFTQKVRRPLIISYFKKKVPMNKLDFCESPPEPVGLCFKKKTFWICYSLSSWNISEKTLSHFWDLALQLEQWAN